ncbi:uncharacterized protein [Maniola hyperantus]|uniref:uncharacterized protein n=1 Tax=Aphantopus hyperantus TaxID=2795564 RepID=UPI0015694D2B|nr:hyphally regulated cell wall protein 3-like [Maniola hyperantus]
MKLLLVFALIAVTSAARLEHLERGYLPPDNNFGTNGFGANIGSFGNGFNSGSNGLGNGINAGNSLSSGFGSNGQGNNGIRPIGQSPSFTNGFGTNGSNGKGQSPTTFGFNGKGNDGSQGADGFGSIGTTNGFTGATSNQYLPPDQSSSGSGAGFNFVGSSIKPACSTCGPNRFSQQYNQVSSSIPGTSYGVPQFDSSLSTNGGSNLGTNFGSTLGSPGSTFQSSEPSGSNAGSSFGSPNGNIEFSSFESQGLLGSQGSLGSQGTANRQYLPPRPSSQNPPQQPFDEKYGYFY